MKKTYIVTMIISLIMSIFTCILPVFAEKASSSRAQPKPMYYVVAQGYVPGASIGNEYSGSYEVVYSGSTNPGKNDGDIIYYNGVAYQYRWTIYVEDINNPSESEKEMLSRYGIDTDDGRIGITEIKDSATQTVDDGKREYDEYDKKLVASILGKDISEVTAEDCENTIPGLSMKSITRGTIIDDIVGGISWLIAKVIIFFCDISDDILGVNTVQYAGSLPVFDAEHDYMNAFMSLFNVLAHFMLLLGLALSIAEEVIRYSNGQGNMFNVVLNFAKAFIYTEIFIVLSLNAFILAQTTGQKVAEQLLMHGGASTSVGIFGTLAVTIISLIKYAGVKAWFIILVFAIVILFLFLQIAILMVKKVPQFITMLAKGSVMPFFIVRGNNSTVSGYLLQLGMFFMQIMLQFMCLGFGLTLVNSAVSSAGIKISFFVGGAIVLMSINEIGGWLGGLSSEDDLGKMVGMLHHSQGLIEGIGKGAEYLSSHFGSNPSDSLSRVGKAAGD